MEVMLPLKDMDFDFNSARSSPFTSPPSTPKPFNSDYYCSAPTSPSHLSQFYREFDNLYVADPAENGRESKPVAFKSDDDDEFAFDFSQELERSSVSADDIFDGGMIKPLKSEPVVKIQTPSRNSNGKVKNRGGVSFSPKFKKDETTPPTIVAENSRKMTERGRQRVPTNGLSSSSTRRSARSLSPMRITRYPWEEQEQEKTEQSQKPCSTLSSSSSSKGSKKWRFKNFFLFRSASEGRASDKDPLKKYTAAYRRSSHEEDIKSSTTVSSSSGQVVVGRRRKLGQSVSSHELHYTINRALSADLKKKTFLPYKQGILGNFAFNPAVHALANGFGLSRK